MLGVLERHPGGRPTLRLLHRARGRVTRRVVTTGRKWERVVGYARAVRVGPAVEISGCAPTAPDGSTVGGRNVYEQTRQCLRIIAEALDGVGAGLEDVTRTRIFTTVPRRWREIGRAHGEVFAAIKPVTSMIGVKGFIDPDWLVEIEASAFVAE
jgi:enamine deaminase RidA (YjgF/YER057c/UK114 family)